MQRGELFILKDFEYEDLEYTAIQLFLFVLWKKVSIVFNPTCLFCETVLY